MLKKLSICILTILIIFVPNFIVSADNQFTVPTIGDTLVVNFYRNDQGIVTFNRDTYVQGWNKDYNGIHYSSFFNRTNLSFFGTWQYGDYAFWELNRRFHSDQSLLLLDNDYLSITYYVVFDVSNPIKSATLILDSFDNDGIELDSAFYTIKPYHLDNSFRYQDGAQLTFYYKMSNVYDLFGAVPHINNFELNLQFQTDYVNYIYFSDLYYSTDSNEAVLSAISDLKASLMGKLDEIAVLISNSMHEDMSAVKESIDKTYDFLSEEPEEEASLDDSSQKVADSIGNLESAEEELDSYKVDIDIDINAILANMPNKTFVGIKTLLDDILVTKYLSTAIMLSLSIGLITFAIGRRVR